MGRPLGKPITLNDEQRELAAQNMKLVPYVIRRCYPLIEENDMDDMVSIGYIGLMKAAYYFRPEHGEAFSTYAGVSIRNEISRYYAAINKQKRGGVNGIVPVSSYNKVCSSGEEMSGGIGCVGISVEDSVLSKICTEQLIKYVPLIAKICDGSNQCQIAKEIGISHQAVSIRVKQERANARAIVDRLGKSIFDSGVQQSYGYWSGKIIC